jgi:hypothetical protein
MNTPLQTALRGSRSLTIMAAVMGGLALVALVGVLVDQRAVLGQPLWLKPFKFGISGAIYGFTLAWLLAFLTRGKRVARVAAATIVVGFTLEVALIVVQAVRARPSHFNVATDLDNAIWSAMGAMAALFGIGTAIVAIILWRNGIQDLATAVATRVGLLLLIVGMGEAFLMVVPTAEQRRLDEIQDQPMLGAHAVNVADGGPGLPVTGWSTTGGDLRVGHFVGVHGLQATLLVAMVLSWKVRDEARRVRVIKVFAGAYAGVLALVTWQALRGQSLTQPDGVTLAAAGGLVVATIAGALLAWGSPSKAQSEAALAEADR